MASILDDLKNEFRSNNMLSRLIIINVAIFFIFNIIRLFLWGNEPLFQGFLSWFAMPVNPWSFILKPWTLITHMFVQVEIGHILFNMLYLWWFGKIFQEYLGNTKILPTYFFGAAAGALLSMLVHFLPDMNHPIIGSSSGVLAILVATATLLPDYTVSLILIGPVRLKYIALVLVGIDLISIPTRDNTAHVAHIGGAIYGYFYIRQLQKGNDWSKGFNFLFEKITNLFKPHPKITVVHKKARTMDDAEYNKNKKNKQEVIDKILDKISKSGYDSLSKEEKDILFKMSKD